MIFVKKKKLSVWCDDPAEDRVIYIFAGCLANHDRAHSLVAACAESQSTSRVPNRTRFLTVQATIRTKMQCDMETLFAEADASKKRNLMLVGGHADDVWRRQCRYKAPMSRQGTDYADEATEPS